jgi:hypothetical protein
LNPPLILEFGKRETTHETTTTTTTTTTRERFPKSATPLPQDFKSSFYKVLWIKDSSSLLRSNIYHEYASPETFFKEDGRV